MIRRRTTHAEPELLITDDPKKFVDAFPSDCTVIGHNLSFDLAYMLKTFTNCKEMMRDWWFCDTQRNVTELSYHSRVFTSLEDALQVYGVQYNKRLDFSKVDPEDVPQKDLIRYLKEDLLYTLELAACQFEEAHIVNIPDNWLISKLPLIMADMHMNGIKINSKRLVELQSKCIKKALAAKVKFIKWLKYYCVPDEITVSPSSPKTIQAMLYGGDFIGHEHKHSRKTTVIHRFNVTKASSMVPAQIKAELYKANSSEGTLREILAHKDTSVELEDFVKTVLDFRHYQKLQDTFISKFHNMMNDDIEDSYIHPTYNIAATRTGRMSSSNPNGQQNPEVIRNLYTSRYKNGMLVKVDFKQLEIHCLAHLCRDYTLNRDLKEGVDIHYTVGKPVFGWDKPEDQDDDDRRAVKGVVFGTVYGGGVNTLSRQSGVDKDTVGKIITSFLRRYPGIKQYNLHVYKNVEISNGLYYDKNNMLNLKFLKYEAPNWLKVKGVTENYKPTQTKNRPVQSLGARVVEEFVENVYIELQAHQDVKVLSIVHDDILFDVPDDEAVIRLTTILKEALELTKARFRIETPLNLSYTVTNGDKE